MDLQAPQHAQISNNTVVFGNESTHMSIRYKQYVYYEIDVILSPSNLKM